MNIFYLDEDPKKAARMHCDKHVVKMILEYTQLLSTAHRVLDGESRIFRSVSSIAGLIKEYPKGKHFLVTEFDTPFEDHLQLGIYRSTHVNHPSAVWVRESFKNYLWVQDCLRELHRIFFMTNNRWHASHPVGCLLADIPKNIPSCGSTPLRVCVSDECLIPNDPVASYRKYYVEAKSHLLQFNRFNVMPTWVKSALKDKNEKNW